MRIHFGSCTMDADTRQLTRAGREVHLSPKAFELLQALVESRPRALSKKDLQKLLWPDVNVLEANLPNLVAEVRAAIGDDARQPTLLRTLHAFGYAFCGEVAEAPGAGESPFVYRLLWQGPPVLLREGDHLLGRHPDAVLCLDSPSVSRKHAVLRVRRGHALVEDLGSKNGTFVQGERIAGPTRLEDGDVLLVGSVPLTFRVLPAPEFSETRE